MNRPTMSEFDGWKNSATGIWFFEYVQDQANDMAGENGRKIGLFDDKGVDHMSGVRMSGFVAGMEEVITHDPFLEEREELESDRKLQNDRD